MKKKMKKKITLALLLVLAVSFCACTKDETVVYNIDDVTYTLDSSWSQDTENNALVNNENDDAYYEIENSIYGPKCSNIEERRKTFASDGSDGIEVEEIEINGTKALKAEEAVNEIMDVNIFFYVGDVEYIIHYSRPFEEDTIAEYTEELLASISW